MTTSPRSVVHVAGARPNFPKLAPVMRALEALGVEQSLVHTGQHYDDQMSTVFFEDLGIPAPTINLGLGGRSNVDSTAEIMMAMQPVVHELAPAMIIVYGDVNSTVASALVGAHLGVQVAHVESGLRSFDRTMPEEVNRVVTDHLSTLHLATADDAVENLAREGISGSVHMVGNPMIDTLLAHMPRYDVEAARRRHGLTGPYAVSTIHRPSNVDSPRDAAEVVGIIHQIADRLPVVVPLHPRSAKTMERAGLADHRRVTVTSPLGYVEFMGLVRGASLVVTDSGGVQEETTVFGVPCLTLRPNTERPVTITEGTNRLVTRASVVDEAEQALVQGSGVRKVPRLWDGRAGQRIAEIVSSALR